MGSGGQWARDGLEMDMTAKPRETYDIAETAAKWGAALDRLRAEQRPGVKSGRGGKAAVLQAVRDRLRTLSGEGYTAGQIADALREVSPRMVRAALRDAAKSNQRRSARRARAGTAGGRDAAPAPSSHAGAVRGPVRTPTDRPPADPVPSPDADATPPTAGTAASAGLTPELRAKHRIPDWADGSDIRPGEDLSAYARRKRVAGPPPDRSKFIGESRVGEF